MREREKERVRKRERERERREATFICSFSRVFKQEIKKRKNTERGRKKKFGM